MSVPGIETDGATERELEALVAQYELAQRNRIACGAFLRSRGLPSGDSLAAVPTGRSAGRALLRSIEAQQESGNAPLLGLLYREETRMEQLLAAAMAECVERHRTRPWLVRVRGIGPVLAARLLARLRIERAPTPSSFWKFCGLATESGAQHRCTSCGTVVVLAPGRVHRGPHRTPQGERCTAPLEAEQSAAVRVAMRHPLRGQRRAFDVGARTICHIIGVSFLRRGGYYRRVYDVLRDRIPHEHPDWSSLHQHRGAMRVTEKLFLAHLWTVWREQLGAGTCAPYEVWRRGHAGVVRSPWTAVDT